MNLFAASIDAQGISAQKALMCKESLCSKHRYTRNLGIAGIAIQGIFAQQALICKESLLNNDSE